MGTFEVHTEFDHTKRYSVLAALLALALFVFWTIFVTVEYQKGYTLELKRQTASLYIKQIQKQALAYKSINQTTYDIEKRYFMIQLLLEEYD